MAGINTIIADDPSLTTRLPEGGKNPIRVIADSSARIPLESKLLNDGAAPVIVAVTKKAEQNKVKRLEAKGAQVLIVDEDKEGHVSLPKLFSKLAQQDICSVLVEGGSQIIGSIVKEHLADKAYFFIAPKLIGGEKAKSAVTGTGIKNLNDAVRLTEISAEILEGGDILVKGYTR